MPEVVAASLVLARLPSAKGSGSALQSGHHRRFLGLNWEKTKVSGGRLLPLSGACDIVSLQGAGFFQAQLRKVLQTTAKKFERGDDVCRSTFFLENSARP